MENDNYTRIADRSAEEQKEALKKFGAAIISGSQNLDAVSALIEKAAASDITSVFVSEVERLASTPEEVKAILSKLKAFGVQIIDSTEK